MTRHKSGPRWKHFARFLGVVLFFVCNAPVNAQTSNRLELLWRFAPSVPGNPGPKPYLTTNELPYERGLAYNPVSHRVLVASRSNKVYVVNAETGADLHQLNMTGITGGQYPISLIESAEDGAIYGGNLSTATLNPNFKLYRWANDNPGTIPTNVVSGDPAPGTSRRWGDVMDVRGSGTNTQVLLCPRYGSFVAILTTTNGTNFTSRTIDLPDVTSGHIALGLTFGAGNTFWGTTQTNPLLQIAFDLVTGTGYTMRTLGNDEFSTAVCPIGVNRNFTMFAGIHVFPPNHLQLYDFPATNGVPVLIGATNFASDNPNVHTAAGSVEFGTNTIYTLDANNGMMAVRILPPAIQPRLDQISLQAGSQLAFNVTASPGNYVLESTTTAFNNWGPVTNVVVWNNGISQVIDSAASAPQRFYRLRTP